MQTTNSISTISRRALAGGLSAITAGLAAPEIAHAATTPSEIARTFRQFEAVRAEADAAEAKAADLREHLIAKHGSGKASAWRGDH
ncbi:MAG TPA: hypothetical protein VHO91_01000, partial [Rhodopila sp.]|nr:hypothetical protein [Rhodopila sp.]